MITSGHQQTLTLVLCCKTQTSEHGGWWTIIHSQMDSLCFCGNIITVKISSDSLLHSNKNSRGIIASASEARLILLQKLPFKFRVFGLKLSDYLPPLGKNNDPRKSFTPLTKI